MIRYILVSPRTGRMVCSIFFTTEKKADDYRRIGVNVWLKPPYYVKGKITEHGSRHAKQHIKSALTALNYKIQKVKIKKVL